MGTQDPDGVEPGDGDATFWKSLPGVLTGFAAVITALIGLIALFYPGGTDGNEERGPGASSEESVTSGDRAPSQGEGGGQSSSRPKADDNPANWSGTAVEGQVTMRSPVDADLELGRVGSAVNGGDLYLYCSGNECRLNAIGSGGLITLVDGPVDRTGCVAALEARQDGVLESKDLAAGKWFCVQTDQAHIALVEVASAPGVGTADLVLDYILWQ